jgi:hypothetical protein
MNNLFVSIYKISIFFDFIPLYESPFYLINEIFSKFFLKKIGILFTVTLFSNLF